MPLPAGWPKRQVVGTFVPLDEAAGVSGTVTFVLTGGPWSTVDGVLVSPEPIVATIANGAIDKLVPITNAPGVSPTGLTYTVTVKLSTGRTRPPFAMQVPSGAGPLNLADVVPLAPSGGHDRLVRSVNGELPDETGNVEVAGGAGGGVASVTAADSTIIVSGTPINPLVAVNAVPQAKVTGLTSALGGKADTSSLAAVATSGSYSDLAGKPSIPNAYTDLTGTVPAAALPAIAVTDFLGAVGSQAAMLALTGEKGDWCTRTDLGSTWIIKGADPTQLASWQELLYPASPVTSVFGRTGTVTGSKADVGLSNVDNTSDVAKPISTATQTALDGKQAAGSYATPTDLASGLAAKATKPVVRRARVTSGSGTGDVPPDTGGLWAEFTPTGTLVIPAAAGDFIDLKVAFATLPSDSTFWDVAVKNGSLVRFLSSGSSSPLVEGDPAFAPFSAVRPFGYTGWLDVEAGDLSGGNVTFVMAVKSNNTGKVLLNANDPFRWSAINHGAVS